MLIQSLPWDSAFFEYNVARLNINDNCSTDFLKKEFFKNSQYNFDVCYIYVYQQSEELSSFLLSIGAVLYDRKVTFKKSLSEIGSVDSNISATELNHLTQDALDIAISSGVYSRFYLDPNFRDKQPLLYKKWITNCFENKDGKVFGVFQDNTLAAIAGVSVSKEVGHLELIAVHPDYRRQGFAKRLIQTAEIFYLNSGASTAEVVTQLNNISACATYKSCGYNLIETVEVWHLWKSNLVISDLPK